MTIFYTLAYQAEKTLERTIQSVMSQTDSDWVWYIVDNAATDRTGEIMRDWAARDARIKPLRNHENHVFEEGNDAISVIAAHDGADYFCVLDADDEYKPDFLAKMTAFMAQGGLDAGCCGYDFIDAPSGKVTGVRVLRENLFLESPESFDRSFPVYHQFMRTHWAKLYRASLLKRCDFSRYPHLIYGGDTIFVLEAFRHAGRVGILAESLHKYWVSPKSVSYEFNPLRIYSDQKLDDFTREFLEEKCGWISPVNNQMLSLVYCSAVMDTLRILLPSTLPMEDKLKNLGWIAWCEKTRALPAVRAVVERGLDQELRDTVMRWLFAQGRFPEQEEAWLAGSLSRGVAPEEFRVVPPIGAFWFLWRRRPKILEAIYNRDYAGALKQLVELRGKPGTDTTGLAALEIELRAALGNDYAARIKCALAARETFPEPEMWAGASGQTYGLDEKIRAALGENPLLAGISAALAVSLRRCVILTARGAYARALDALIEASDKIAVADGDAEAYVTFAMNLAAAAEDAAAFVYFENLREELFDN